jgi:branched-chain amino acid transport system permease protein
VLLAAFIGGAAFFFGPILGAIVFVFFAVALSEYTKAWQLYLGVFFILMVMFAPGGLASLLLLNLRVAKFGKFRRLLDPYVGVIGSGLLLALGVVLVVEMSYHLSLGLSQGSVIRVFGLPFDTASVNGWVPALGILAAGAAAFEWYRREFKARWGEIAGEIEDWLRENPEDAP